MFFAYNAGHGDRLDAAGKKKGLWVAVAKRLQHFVPPQKIEVQLRETDLMIEPQPRLQILIGQKVTRNLTELFREKIEILFLNRKPRGHFVSAVLVDPVRASRQCLHQIETFNAAAAPFSDAVLVHTNHKRGSMILTCDARSHDSQDAGMPTALENNNRRVALGIEL